MNTPVAPIRKHQPALRYQPGRVRSPEAPPLVLLHGWGHTSSCWNRLLPLLPQVRDVYLLDLPGFGENGGWVEADLDEVVATIEAMLPERCSLLGWSLGGMLAVRLAAQYPEKVESVITLATNRAFVAHAGWQHAMAPATFTAFDQGFAADPVATVRRFTGLQVQGDSNARNLLRVVREHTVTPQGGEHKQWQAGLHWLAQVDCEGDLEKLQMPLLQLFGEKDALVPVAAAHALETGRGDIEVLPNAGHALPISHATAVAERVAKFLAPSTAPRGAEQRIDKHRMAQSFSAAAATYDSAAHVQRQVATRLLEYCPAVAQQSVLDLGCGTGFCTRELVSQGAQVTALDIAPGMLQQARANVATAVHWACGDADQLPFGNAVFAGVVSSLTVQWSDSLGQLFADVRRVLQPGGWCLFSTLGPRTLYELTTAWSQVDEHKHVNDFIGAGQVERMLQEAGLHTAIFEEASLVPRYDKLTQLMRELKALGAHNVNVGRNAGLTSPRELNALIDAYEQFRDEDGKLSAHYQVFYVLAHKPAVGTAPS